MEFLLFSLPIRDPVLIFGLTLVLLLVPLLLGRLRLPSIVGLILVGAIVGPKGLGLLDRSETFVLLGTVGILYLMFLAGLSLDLQQFNRLRERSLLFGLLSFGLPQGAAIVLAGPVLGYELPAALLLGSIVGSHTLLAYPLAHRLGITRLPSVIMATGGTMVTDLLSLLILAIVEATLRGNASTVFWVTFVVLILAYAGVVLVLFPRIGRWFFRTVRNQGDAAFIFVLALLFFSASLASLVRLAPIIGAFLAGLALNRLIPEQSTLMQRLRFTGETLFIPFFLLSVGMLVDLRLLISSLQLWGMALFFTGLVLVFKSLAAFIAGRLFRYSREEVLTVIGLTTPQAAATLAVTLIGFGLNLFDERTVNAVVVMILLTCLIGPSLVAHFGRALALKLASEPQADTGTPPQRILVPLANPQTATELTELALLLRAPTTTEPLYPLTVARPGENEAEQVAQSEQLLGQAVVLAAAADVPVKPLTRIDVNVAQGIARAVREERISTIVMGWDGSSPARTLIFGSILDEVLRETRCEVIVCRLVHPPNTHQRIVVLLPPYLTRDPAFPKALTLLHTLTRATGASLHVLLTQTDREGFSRAAQQHRPPLNYTPVELERWAIVPQKLSELLQENDLLILLTVRNGKLAWRPSLDRLPRLLASRFPTHNFLTLYLAETALEVDRQAELQRRLLTNFRIVQPQQITESAQMQLLHILQELLPHNPRGAQELAQQLGDPQAPYAPEAIPGVALYSAHTAHVDELVFAIAYCPTGLILPRTSQPVKMALFLLVPLHETTETYLTLLEASSRLARNPEDLLEMLNTPE
jgi:Kef-type K+ transport system membrane component KefB